MELSSAEKELVWESRQLADKTRRRLEFREWIKNFALVASLLALTVAVASVLASRG